jgi:hypothetical protein
MIIPKEKNEKGRKPRKKTSHRDAEARRTQWKKKHDSRVEPGSYPPGTPTDPDVPN